MTEEHEPLIRVMALHALAYCERLFYLEEVEEIRLADERVYAGRTLHEELLPKDDEGIRFQTFEIASEKIGLSGKLDALVHRGGAWVPYEHKRGRCRRGEDNSPEAWPADALQVSAYGMLLEEATGTRVSEGRVRYHAENVTVRVPLDDAARASVTQGVERAKTLRASRQRPPIAKNERLCLKCSLAPVCLPEEERAAHEPEWEAVRLYPPVPDGEVVHITAHKARVGRSGDTLLIHGEDEEETVIPIRELTAVVFHGYGQMTTQALHLCASHQVSVHWFSVGGNYVGGLSTGTGGVQRRLRQYEALCDGDLRLQLARRTALAKVESQLRYVLRSTRATKPRSDSVRSCIRGMRSALRGIARAGDHDAVRGHEGVAGKSYFAALAELLKADVPASLRPKGRSRRPPKDRFNALLSFGYGLLYRSVLQAVLAVGLEPAFGYYHQPRSAAYPLVLDLMELFRVPLWDMPLIGSINRQHWDPEADFQVTKAKVWLSEAGRRKAIVLFECRLAEAWKHPVLNYSLAYARTLELETRLLEKEWNGQPGLFARARIR